MPEPLELATITQRTAEARQAFAHDVDQLLDGLHTMLDDADVLDVTSVRLTLQAMRQIVLEKFDQQIALPRVDPLGLQQLVRDAWSLLVDPENTVNFETWKRQAEPFVRTR